MKLFLILFLGVLGLDWGSKALVRARLPLGAEVSIFPFFSLTHVENTGIAFGLFQGRNLFFLVLGLSVMTGLIIYAVRLRHEDRFTSLVLAGVLGGALGNLLDRIFYGAVTDFLDFYWGSHHWPSFNVADSTICVGMVLLAYKAFQKSPSAGTTH
ncbi:MAG: Lipoprotein signal peptidase [Elusimicrobia bacterium]|nr:Lipoprotein signal peptidase [Elusimicrobiota bacterium]